MDTIPSQRVGTIAEACLNAMWITMIMAPSCAPCWGLFAPYVARAPATGVVPSTAKYPVTSWHNCARTYQGTSSTLEAVQSARRDPGAPCYCGALFSHRCYPGVTFGKKSTVVNKWGAPPTIFQSKRFLKLHFPQFSLIIFRWAFFHKNI